MELIIKQDKSIQGKVLANKIHGKFPYKLYLEMIGNSIYGDYIAIISNEEITNNKSPIDTVIIQLEDKMSMDTQRLIRSNTQGIRPNTVSNKAAKYKVKEVNVLDIGRKPIMVFRPIKS